MLKNENGYLLAETMIALTVIATAITIIYALFANYYTKQNNNVVRYNTVDGLYVAKEVKKYFSDDVYDYEEEIKSTNFKDLTSIDETLVTSLDIKKIFFSKYVITNSLINSNGIPNSLKKEILSLNDKNTDKCSYRYLIIFKDNSYSTIGVECFD